jgi:hypothetical protein
MNFSPKQIKEINSLLATGFKATHIDKCLDCDYIGTGAVSTYHTIYNPGHRVRPMIPTQKEK